MALSQLHPAVWSHDKWKYGNKDEHWVLMVKDRSAVSGKCYDWTKEGRQPGTGRGLLITAERLTSSAYGLPELKLKEEMGIIRPDMLNIVEWAATSANGGASSRKYVLAVVELLVNRGLVDAQHLYALRRSYDKVKYGRYKDSMERQEKFQKQFRERTEAQAQAEAAKANIRQPVYDQNAQGLVLPTPERRLHQNPHSDIQTETEARAMASNTARRTYDNSVLGMSPSGRANQYSQQLQAHEVTQGRRTHWGEQTYQQSPQTYQQRQSAGLPLAADTKHSFHDSGGWAPPGTATQTKHSFQSSGGWAPAGTARQTGVNARNAGLMPIPDLYIPRRHSHSPNRAPLHGLKRRPSLNQLWDGPQVRPGRGRVQVKAKPLTQQQITMERQELAVLARQHGRGGKAPGRFGKIPGIGGRH